MLLLVPDAHVGGTIEVGEGSGVAADSFVDGGVVDEAFECEFHVE